ncbi:thiosulfate reductase cytochrome B subunit [Telmatospirillum sp.]|uniref:thiosulfate reductase cytochrome B subunit n=1 Tax=Telmatospirillum sp. TaxID=2079197 RepID=UPI002845E04F|nr:thiosulfate reductase cytochrome B subunit [Telmatospirillum sp.]MDR3439106.1 thiosulfate reductase cytochrome B subunit [Telmatospirillum sp.]
MNGALSAVDFQTQLGQFAKIYAPSYWPQWLIAGAVLLLGMLLALALHGALRYRFSHHQDEPSEAQYLYPLAIRLWHWSNALLFAALLASGVINHFALLLPKETAGLVTFHFVCGCLLAATWAAFVAINIVTGNGRHYLVRASGLVGRMTLQTKYYLGGIIRGEPHPFHANAQSKFNPLQQVAYLGVAYALIPLLVITGLLSSSPDWLGTSLLGLRHWIFELHFVLAIASLFFIGGHIYLCTTGRTPLETFRSMIDGYHR